MSKVIQKILFGSPGTGKSYKIVNEILPTELNIQNGSENCIKTVFHPEYTYGDFVGKILPLSTNDKSVTYKYYTGHFLNSLAQAYQNILIDEANPQNVALVIDEINRGNSAAIFGTIFQLLDRNVDGWSDYEISLSDIEYMSLLHKIGIEHIKDNTYKINENIHEKLTNKNNNLLNILALSQNKEFFKEKLNHLFNPLKIKTESKQIKLPPNLHIIASMNTSDNSLYYMDSAFKRRWEWEFIDIDGRSASNEGIAFDRKDWTVFVNKLNMFIKDNYKYVRNIEDKQIGYWFINDFENISKKQIQNKLMFFIWDSVFSRDKKPLFDVLGIIPENLVTFGDFCKNVDTFIKNILEYTKK